MSDKGKTLWEMLMARLHGPENGNGSGLPFYNPMDLRVGSVVNVPYSNGPQFAGFDFQVSEIREYTRRLGAEDFRFTDYWLAGVNTKSFAKEDTLRARIRTVPNSAGAYDSLLLRLYDEFAFAEDFLNVVKDDTGIFELSEGENTEKATFSRINDLRTSYEAVVLSVTGTTPDGKAAQGHTKGMKIEYWDYWRDMPLDTGKTAKEFLLVEMDSETGWFQIWRGNEFFD
jgi:hypothetical protein